MNDNYAYRIKRVIQGTFFILAASFLGWGFTPVPKWFAGLILGLSLGLISTLFAAWKVHKVGEVALKYKGQRKRASLGTFARFSMAILATVIALEFPQVFSLSGMAIGLLLPSFVAFGDAVYLHMKMKKREKGVNHCAY